MGRNTTRFRDEKESRPPSPVGPRALCFGLLSALGRVSPFYKDPWQNRLFLRCSEAPPPVFPI
eukprot:scaffold79087_cov27-Tisochrysis_lutea.AAC.1